MSGPIIWGAPQWLLPACVLTVAVLLGLLLGYRRASAGWAGRLAPCLKVCGVLALAACLVEPLVHGMRPRPGANLFLVLVDNSESLRLRDPEANESCADQLRPRLDEETKWHARLAQDFDVRRYAFDSRLRSFDNLKNLPFDGTSSSLGEALASISERYRERPVAGVLLFTDGNATDEVASNDLPPIFPVVLGNDETASDLRVEHATASLSNFESAPAVIQASIVSQGLAGKPLVIQLRDHANQVVEQQTAIAGDKPLRVQFRFRPEQSGISFYQVCAYPQDEVPPEGTDERREKAQEQSSEATTVNNSRLVQVEQLQGPYRILYVGGRPNWEFKFLRRAIEQDRELDLVGLIRIANREPKFDFRGHIGESSNPLFRGFDEQDPEEVERYDQPVLIRLSVDSPEELREGFPKTEEQLYPFHAIILDDIDAAFFTTDQMMLIERFVSQRGGGLMMLGGSESFVQGGYDRTPIGDLLPVYTSGTVEDIDAASNDDEGHLSLHLTREGSLQPWLRLRGTEVEEMQRYEDMPRFKVRNRVGNPKPGASELMMAEDRQGRTAPALAVQRFGKGRTAAFTIGDFWRWGIRQDTKAGRDDFRNQWVQIVRWLVTDVPRRVEVQSRQLKNEPNQPVLITVKLRDEAFEALDNAQVHVRITGPDGSELQLPAEASTSQAGTYECRFVPREHGTYRATVHAVGADGQQFETRATGWVYEPANEECKSLTPNRELLERLATQSDGELLELDDLEAFVGSLPNRKVPVTEPWIYPLWHRWPVFLLALGCLVGEWGLRRWRGLP